MNIQDLFMLAMKRDIPSIIPNKKSGIILNLGGGVQQIPNSINLQLPEWNAETDLLPYDEESVDQIHMYHFLEHLTDPIRMLLDCQRVLKYGGHCNILVPYYKCKMAVQDLDHKKMFSAEYLKQTFSNPYYNNRGLSIQCEFEIKKLNIVIGIVDRNLGILSQIVKV